MALQRHHWLPLSLYGIDNGANIIAVEEATHVMIHQVMNYKYRVFTRMWREFRKRHNGKFLMDDKMATDILRMQMGYLDRYHKLPKVAQNMHFQKMNELTHLYNPEHGWDKDWRFLSKKYENAFKAYHL